MTTPAPQSRPLTVRASRARSQRPGLGWDVVVTVLVGLTLLTFGWVDVRKFLATAGRPSATFRLANLGGDTRVGQDEFFHVGGAAVRLGNMGTMESAGNTTFRHAYGPVDTVEIWSERTNATLEFAFVVISDEQRITVTFNGQPLEEIAGGRQLLRRTYPLTLHTGANEFTISFSQYNHHGIEFENQDTRPIAGTFQTLNLSLP